jgi:hypothetical protein
VQAGYGGFVTLLLLLLLLLLLHLQKRLWLAY